MNITERLLLIRFETRNYVQKINLYGQLKADFNFFLGFPPNQFNLQGSILCESMPLTKPEGEENCLEFGKFRIYQQDETGSEVPLEMQRNVECNVSQVQTMALIVTKNLDLSEDNQDFLETIRCEKKNIVKVKSDNKEKLFLVRRQDEFETSIDRVEGQGWRAIIYPLWTITPTEQNQLVLDILWDAKFGLVHHRMIPLTRNMLPIFQGIGCGIIDHVNINNEKVKSIKKIFLTTEEDQFPKGTKRLFDDYGEIKKWTKKEAAGMRWIEVDYKRAEDAASAVDDSVNQDGIDVETGKVFCLRDNKISKQSRKRGPTSPLPQVVPPARSKRDDEQEQLDRRFRTSVTTEDQPTAGPSGWMPPSANTGRSTVLQGSALPDVEDIGLLSSPAAEEDED